MAKIKLNKKTETRSMYKKYVTQKELDEALKLGILCLEGWHLKEKRKKQKNNH